MRSYFLALLALPVLVGCAFFKRSPQTSYNEILNVEDADAKEAELADNVLAVSDSGAILLAPEDTSFAGPLEAAHLQIQNAPVGEASDIDEVVEAGPLAVATGQDGPLNVRAVKAQARQRSRGSGGATENYHVVAGDTLMEIAFEKYANFYRWREIYRINRNKMSHYTKMPVGTILTLHNVQYVLIHREGKPYLIRKNDTLKSIAQHLYGDETRWRDLWKSNPELIRDPTKLYAGFTLYYQPDAADLRTPAQSF